MFSKTAFLCSTLVLLPPVPVFADADDSGFGDLPTTSPGETIIYTINDICKRLETGAAGGNYTIGGPISGPGNTATCTIDRIMELLPKVDAENGAKPDDVLKGKKYWGLGKSGGGEWGMLEGSVELPESVDTKASVDCTKAYPGGENRFKDNENGTVTDNCTKLTWLKNPNCWKETKNWNSAKTQVEQLKSGECNQDKSRGWRLPTSHELNSLIDHSNKPCLPTKHPFGDSVKSGGYWSSTPRRGSSSSKFYVNFKNCRVDDSPMGDTDLYVWPVWDEPSMGTTADSDL